ncbi:MAG: hypothetical protein R6V49_04915 [Bacteroidales bacterium]
MKEMIDKGWATWKGFSRKQRIIILSVKGIVLVGLLLLLILFPGNSSPRIELLPYNSNQGGFTINAPDGVMQMTQEKFVFLGNALTKYTHLAKLPEGSFSVTHFDMPPGVITPSERNNILNLLAAEFVAPVQGFVGTTAEATVQGYAGISIAATGIVDEKEMFAEGIILPVANRVYIAGVYAEKGMISQKKVKAFLESLTFNF